MSPLVAIWGETARTIAAGCAAGKQTANELDAAGGQAAQRAREAGDEAAGTITRAGQQAQDTAGDVASKGRQVCAPTCKSLPASGELHFIPQPWASALLLAYIMSVLAN